jgi:hypothetical protein
MNSAPYTPRPAAREGDRGGSRLTPHATGGQGDFFATVGGSGRDIYAGGGGGGGSFDGGRNQFLEGNIRAGDGEVLITEIGGAGAPPVPEPSTRVTMATGLAALGLAGLRRRKA